MNKSDYVLFEALQRGDIPEFERALTHGADVDCTDKVFITPLISAIFSNKPDFVRLLLAAGANPNLGDPDTGNPPLAFAGFKNINPFIFKALLKAGANLDALNFDGISARQLIESKHVAHQDILNILKAIPPSHIRTSRSVNDASSTETGRDKVTFVPKGEPWSAQEQSDACTAMSSGRAMDMSKAISHVAQGAGARRMSDLQWAELTESVQIGLAAAGLTPDGLAAALLKHAPSSGRAYMFSAENAPANREELCSDLGNPLDIAAAHGEMAQIRFWVAACGPNWNPDGMSPPLSWTVHGKQPQSTRLLLELGADPNLKARLTPTASTRVEVSQSSPLHLAIHAQQFDIAIMLLKAGALATGTDRDSLAALREAIDENQRTATVVELSKTIHASDLEVCTRSVGALGALCACDWTRDSDFEVLTTAAQAARLRFGDEFLEACRHALESVAHLEVDFQARLDKRANAHTYRGSIMDRAAATGARFALSFFATCAGPEWNPDGGDRPIDWAANVGDSRAIDLLASIGAGLDVDPKNPDGDAPPPLARASAGGWREASLRLLILGADPAALQDDEAAKTAELLGAAGLSEVETLARTELTQSDPKRAYFGLHQLWSLVKAGWAKDWELNLDALHHTSQTAWCELGPDGITVAGSTLLKTGGYLMFPVAAGHALGGEANFFSRAACAGSEQACQFLVRSLGANFRHPQDNGSVLANAVAMKQSKIARMLISAGASLSGEPDVLGLSVATGSWSDFLMLASSGAKPDRLSLAQRQVMITAFEAQDAQLELSRVIPCLPAQEDGFDEFLADGSMPSAFMARLVSSGAKERFWRNRHKIDWTRAVSELSEVARSEGEWGLGAYARFRRALAADDIEAAVHEVASTPALLASLSKRGLVDETILSSLGAGRTSLLSTMVQQGWPLESSMRAHAAQVMLVVAEAKDARMFEMLLPMIPADGSLNQDAQGPIAKAAWALGGAPLLHRLDAHIEGLSPQVIDACREAFSGVDGERVFSELIHHGLEREAQRTRSVDNSGTGAARRRAYFQLTTRHWTSLNAAQRLSAALSIASWNEVGLWETAEKAFARLNAHSRRPVNPNGSDAFFFYCFAAPATVTAILAVVDPAMIVPFSAAAQMAAALADDADMASIATARAGCPCSDRALVASARLGHKSAFEALLSRAEGSSLQGLFSRTLMAPSEAEFFSPTGAGYDLPDWACRRLASVGAGFLAQDIEGPGLARVVRLAQLASQGQVSLVREKAFSTLALCGTMPERAWMSKPEILTREPSLLEWASELDKNSPELVKAAVSVDGMMLRHAGPVARATLSVVLTATLQNVDAASCAYPSLVQALGLRTENALSVLIKTVEDMQTINPLRVFARKAAVIIERSALAQAQTEIETAQRARALDFNPLERAIADARMTHQDRAQAEMALSFARSVRQSFEKGGKASNMDMADLRRLVERNMPDLINGYTSTEVSTRDAYDPATRSTPNHMLRSGLRDAMTSMQNVAARIDDGARVALRGEALVLETKATSAEWRLEQRQAESLATQQEVEQSTLGISSLSTTPNLSRAARVLPRLKS